MRNGIERPDRKPWNRMFHVKPLILATLASAAALTLCACQAAPADEVEATLPVKQIKEIAMMATSIELPDPEPESLDSEEAVPLPTPEEAEELTGIVNESAGIEYTEGEILVTLKRNASIPDINRQLSLCDFIQETRIGNEMMVIGEIRDGKIQRGASGKAVVLLHTTEGVQVNQAIASLEGMGQLANASPNYLLNIQNEEAEMPESVEPDQEGSEDEQQ